MRTERKETKIKERREEKEDVVDCVHTGGMSWVLSLKESKTTRNSEQKKETKIKERKERKKERKRRG